MFYYTKQEPVTVESNKYEHLELIIKIKKRFIFKFISLAVVGIFAFQQIVWAQGTSPAIQKPIENPARSVQEKITPVNIKLPYELVQKNEIHVTEKEDEVVIHLQDAHASLSAQYSLVELLDLLVSNYDLNLIAMEGAEGSIDTSILSSFPEAEVKKETAALLMKEGRLGAAEFFDITRNDEDVALYGIEDSGLYQENLNSFCAVIDKQAGALKNINALLEQIREIEEKAYSKDLLFFLEQERQHRDKDLSFKDYWGHINSFVDRFAIKLDKYVNIGKLNRSIDLEKNIDFAAANNERRLLMDELSGKTDKGDLEVLVLKSIDFKEKKISASEFYKYLKTLAESYKVDLKPYDNLLRFSEYMSIYESMDIFKLYAEIDILQDAIREKLYINEDERTLYEISTMMLMLEKLYKIEMTNTDFYYAKKYLARYNTANITELVKDKCAKYDITIKNGYDVGKVFSYTEEAINFYEVAADRDRVMIANTLHRMRKDGKRVAALITGGYHTKGLTELMRDKGLSYMVIVPKFEAGEDRPYIAVLTGKTNPYQKLLESGKYNIAVGAYFASENFNTERLIRTIAKAAGLSALISKRDWERNIELWIREYTRQFDALTSGKDVPEEPAGVTRLDPEEFRRILYGLEVRRKGDIAVVVYGETIIMALERSEDGTYEEAESITAEYTEIARIESPSKAVALVEDASAYIEVEVLPLKYEEELALVSDIRENPDPFARELIDRYGKDAGDNENIEKGLLIKGLRPDWRGDEELAEQVDMVIFEVGARVEVLNVKARIREMQVTGELEAALAGEELLLEGTNNRVLEINHKIRTEEYEKFGNLDLPDTPSVRTRKNFEFKGGEWEFSEGDGLTLLMEISTSEDVDQENPMMPNLLEITGGLRAIEPDTEKLDTKKEENLHITVEALIANTEEVSRDKAVDRERGIKREKAREIVSEHDEVIVEFYYKDISMDNRGDIAAFGYMVNASLHDIRGDLRENGISAKPTNIVHISLGRIFDENISDAEFEEYKDYIKSLRNRRGKDGKPALLGRIRLSQVKIWDQRLDPALRHGESNQDVIYLGRKRVAKDTSMALEESGKSAEKSETITEGKAMVPVKRSETPAEKTAGKEVKASGKHKGIALPELLATIAMGVGMFFLASIGAWNIVGPSMAVIMLLSMLERYLNKSVYKNKPLAFIFGMLLIAPAAAKAADTLAWVEGKRPDSVIETVDYEGRSPVIGSTVSYDSALVAGESFEVEVRNLPGTEPKWYKITFDGSEELTLDMHPNSSAHTYVYAKLNINTEELYVHSESSNRFTYLPGDKNYGYWLGRVAGGLSEAIELALEGGEIVSGSLGDLESASGLMSEFTEDDAEVQNRPGTEPKWYKLRYDAVNSEIELDTRPNSSAHTYALYRLNLETESLFVKSESSPEITYETGDRKHAYWMGKMLEALNEAIELGETDGEFIAGGMVDFSRSRDILESAAIFEAEVENTPGTEPQWYRLGYNATEGMIELDTRPNSSAHTYAFYSLDLETLDLYVKSESSPGIKHQPGDKGHAYWSSKFLEALEAAKALSSGGQLVKGRYFNFIKARESGEKAMIIDAEVKNTSETEQKTYRVTYAASEGRIILNTSEDYGVHALYDLDLYSGKLHVDNRYYARDYMPWDSNYTYLIGRMAADMEEAIVVSYSGGEFEFGTENNLRKVRDVLDNVLVLEAEVVSAPENEYKRYHVFYDWEEGIMTLETEPGRVARNVTYNLTFATGELLINGRSIYPDRKLRYAVALKRMLKGFDSAKAVAYSGGEFASGSEQKIRKAEEMVVAYMEHIKGVSMPIMKVQRMREVGTGLPVDTFESEIAETEVDRTYYADTGLLESETFDEADEEGLVYKHYVNEEKFGGWQPVDVKVRSELDEYGAIGYEIGYHTGSPLANKYTGYRYADHSDPSTPELSGKVVEIDYDVSGSRKSTLTYYESGNKELLEERHEHVGRGSSFEHYLDDRMNLKDWEVFNVPDEYGAIAYEIEYHPGTPLAKSRIGYRDVDLSDPSDPVFIGKVVEITYDVSGSENSILTYYESGNKELLEKRHQHVGRGFSLEHYQDNELNLKDWEVLNIPDEEGAIAFRYEYDELGVLINVKKYREVDVSDINNPVMSDPIEETTAEIDTIVSYETEEFSYTKRYYVDTNMFELESDKTNMGLGITKYRYKAGTYSEITMERPDGSVEEYVINEEGFLQVFFDMLGEYENAAAWYGEAVGDVVGDVFEFENTLSDLNRRFYELWDISIGTETVSANALRHPGYHGNYLEATIVGESELTVVDHTENPRSPVLETIYSYNIDTQTLNIVTTVGGSEVSNVSYVMGGEGFNDGIASMRGVLDEGITPIDGKDFMVKGSVEIYKIMRNSNVLAGSQAGTTTYADTGLLESETFDEADEEGLVYKHYVNEERFGGWQPVDVKVRSELDEYGAIGYEIEYHANSPLASKYSGYRYADYSDPSNPVLTGKVVEITYDVSGSLKSILTYYESGNKELLEKRHQHVGRGFSLEHYQDNKLNLKDWEVLNIPDEEGAIAFRYEYDELGVLINVKKYREVDVSDINNPVMSDPIEGEESDPVIIIEDEDPQGDDSGVIYDGSGVYENDLPRFGMTTVVRPGDSDEILMLRVGATDTDFRLVGSYGRAEPRFYVRVNYQSGRITKNRSEYYDITSPLYEEKLIEYVLEPLAIGIDTYGGQVVYGYMRDYYELFAATGIFANELDLLERTEVVSPGQSEEVSLIEVEATEEEFLIYVRESETPPGWYTVINFETGTITRKNEYDRTPFFTDYRVIDEDYEEKMAEYVLKPLAIAIDNTADGNIYDLLREYYELFADTGIYKNNIERLENTDIFIENATWSDIEVEATDEELIILTRENDSPEGWRVRISYATGTITRKFTYDKSIYYQHFRVIDEDYDENMTEYVLKPLGIAIENQELSDAVLASILQEYYDLFAADVSYEAKMEKSPTAEPRWYEVKYDATLETLRVYAKPNSGAHSAETYTVDLSTGSIEVSPAYLLDGDGHNGLYVPGDEFYVEAVERAIGHMEDAIRLYTEGELILTMGDITHYERTIEILSELISYEAKMEKSPTAEPRWYEVKYNLINDNLRVYAKPNSGGHSAEIYTVELSTGSIEVSPAYLLDGDGHNGLYYPGDEFYVEAVERAIGHMEDAIRLYTEGELILTMGDITHYERTIEILSGLLNFETTGEDVILSGNRDIERKVSTAVKIVKLLSVAALTFLWSALASASEGTASSTSPLITSLLIVGGVVAVGVVFSKFLVSSRKGEGLVEASRDITAQRIEPVIGFAGDYVFKRFDYIPHGEDKITVSIGIQSGIFQQLYALGHLEAWLRMFPDVDEFVMIDEQVDLEKMRQEFSERTKGRKVIGGIIDNSVLEENGLMDEGGHLLIKDDQESIEVLAAIILDFAQKAEKDILRLNNPDVADMTYDEVRAEFDSNADLALLRGKYKGVITVLSRLSEDVESLGLMEKSIYDLKLDKSHQLLFMNYKMTAEAMKFVKSGYVDGERKYVSVSAKTAADMKFIANALRDMGLDKEKASGFIQVRVESDSINGSNLEKYMANTGLSKYLDVSNIVILSSDDMKEMSLEKVLGLVKARFGSDIPLENIAVGDATGILREEDKALLKGEDVPVYVMMEGYGLASQLLRAVVEIVANDGYIPESLGEITVTMEDGSTWYIYLPDIRSIDIDKLKEEIAKYNQILSAA